MLALLFAVAACNRSAPPAQADSQNGQRGGNGANGQRGGRNGGRGAGAGQVVNVKAVKVPHISIQRSVDLSGTLVAIDQVHVSSEVAGVIKTVNIELGQEVQAGQVLVELNTNELELALARAESALRQTEAQLGIDNARSAAIPPDEEIASVRTALANRDDARAQFNRAEELIGKGLMAKSEHDTTETRLKVTEAALQASLENVRALKASLQDRRAAYELAKKKVNDAAIRAPVSGAISERLVQRGEYLRENTPVATIVQMNPLKLQTSVQEKYANTIRPNMPVEFAVESFPGETFKGKIANISPAINQQSRTFPIEIQVDNSSRKLKPGFFAKGSILTQVDNNVTAVPQETLTILAGVASVFVIENGMVRQQNITLGAQKDTYYEALTGLKGDEVLAASNLNQIVTGMQVSTNSGEEADPAEAAAAPPGGQGAQSGQRRGDAQGFRGDGNAQAGQRRGQRRGGTE